MAYVNYLVKVGNYTIPNNYIKLASYQAVKNIIDVNTYRDADGVLHRDALAHSPNKVEFETVPMLTGTQFATIMSNIQSNFSVAAERKASVTAYIPESDSYVVQNMYMPDITPKIYSVSGGVVKYESVRLAFIGY